MTMTYQIKRDKLVEIIDRAIWESLYVYPDAEKLENVARTAERVAVGSNSIGFCGCPVMKAFGQINEDDSAETSFIAGYDRAMQDHVGYKSAFIASVID